MKSPKETKVSGMGTYGVSGELRVKGIPRLRPNSKICSQRGGY